MCHNVVIWVWWVSTLNKYQSTPNYEFPSRLGLNRISYLDVFSVSKRQKRFVDVEASLVKKLLPVGQSLSRKT